jgi:regulatory factor X
VHSFDQHDLQPQFSQSQPPRPAHFSQPQYNTSFVSEPLQPALLQAAQHVSAQDNLMNTSMESLQQFLGYPVDANQNHPVHSNGMSSQPMDAHAYHQSMSQPPQQSQYMTPLVEVEDKKKKGSTSGSATNDKELRQMLQQNEGRKLKDVAAEVIQTDRTSKAEKSKQLFAMLWSVHRTRVMTVL